MPEIPPVIEKLAKANRVLRSLIDSISDNDLDQVAKVWREAMGAERRYFQERGKDPETGRSMGAWVSEPDHKTRIQAANMVAAYREGLPVQRQIQLNAHVESLADTLAKVRSSPETMKALESMGIVLPTAPE